MHNLQSINLMLLRVAICVNIHVNTYPQGVLIDTAEACGEAALAAERTAEICNLRELRIIQGQQHIVQPNMKFKCSPWDKVVPA
jgi:hypothetical protein